MQIDGSSLDERQRVVAELLTVGEKALLQLREAADFRVRLLTEMPSLELNKDAAKASQPDKLTGSLAE